MNFAISLNNISKRYVLRHEQQARYTALRDVMAAGARRLVRTLRHPLGGYDAGDPAREEFWALNDVSLDIKPGERVGIVGRNGAGKSTLLKVLSRITEPTKGRVQLRGRVASLLEVGTGFHPELSGRENIFLNGAILGMSKAEIRRKFDAIVEFAEVERFLDTPVKWYSSGMYVRLAFSVAAHLDSDILIVDEVLAVGDARFQKRCMGHMTSVANSGRTILFVSHNMGAVSELCNRAILLRQGSVVCDGVTNEIIEQYLAVAHQESGTVELTPDRDVPIYVSGILLLDEDGTAVAETPLGSDAVLEIRYTLSEPLVDVSMAMLLSRMGTPLLYSYDTDTLPVFEESPRAAGDYVARVPLPLSRFKEGLYTSEVKIGVGQTNMTDERAVLSFEISNHRVNTANKSYRADRPGHLHWPLDWQTEERDQ